VSLTGEAEFRRASVCLREGKLAQAESICRDLLARMPRNAAVTHLLGLVRKESGDAEGGERLMLQSIALEPARSEFRANLANLQRKLGRLRDAERSYREALGCDPANAAARLGLARTLNDLGEHAAAEEQCRALVAARPRDPQAWSALAMALRDQQKLEDAEAAYRQAIEVDPGHGPAHLNLGSVLSRLERAEEALEALNRAQARGVQGFEFSFNRARTLLQLYRIEEAEREFARAVALNPLHPDAQINLARMRFMRRDPDFARDIVAAAERNPADASLQILQAIVLRRAGNHARAEGLLRDAIARLGPSPAMRACLAEGLHEVGRLAEAQAEALEAAAAKPDDAAIAQTLVAIMLARGHASDALPFIRRQRELLPSDQGWIAYEATAARLLGQPLYGELYDYDRLVRTYELEAPAGWSSMEELNAALLDALARRHQFATHPLDQSLRNGSQTARNLVSEPDPAIRAILQAFEPAIEDFRRAVGTDPRHALSARNRAGARITGAWSVQLRRDGFHVNHFHPEGWMSSAYYVGVPAEVRDEQLRSGWIKFGEPRFPVPGATAERFVQPAAGRLVLFPSYMWHGTNPIHGAEPRTTIAFDASPT
jgi:tetratricopeptide (TPR) repeat protein